MLALSQGPLLQQPISYSYALFIPSVIIFLQAILPLIRCLVIYLPVQPSPGYFAVHKQSNSYIYPSTLIETFLLVISNRSHISTFFLGHPPTHTYIVEARSTTIYAILPFKNTGTHVLICLFSLSFFLVMNSLLLSRSLSVFLSRSCVCRQTGCEVVHRWTALSRRMLWNLSMWILGGASIYIYIYIYIWSTPPQDPRTCVLTVNLQYFPLFCDNQIPVMASRFCMIGKRQKNT